MEIENKPVAIGNRIRLIEMPDDPHPIKPGEEGVVTGIDDLGQIMMRWDSGSSLSLIPGVDKFEVIEEEATKVMSKKDKIIITVSGGVADIKKAPKDAHIFIVDKDNIDNGDPYEYQGTSYTRADDAITAIKSQLSNSSFQMGDKVFAIILVDGGVAELVTSNVPVEIIDHDNMAVKGKKIKDVADKFAQELKYKAGWYCMDVDADKKKFIKWLESNCEKFGLDSTKAVSLIRKNDSWCTDNDEDMGLFIKKAFGLETKEYKEAVENDYYAANGKKTKESKKVNPFHKENRNEKVYTAMIEEAKEEKAWAEKVSKDEAWMKNASEYIKEHIKNTLEKSVEEIADQSYWYLEYRANLKSGGIGGGFHTDKPAKEKWERLSGETIAADGKKVKNNDWTVYVVGELTNEETKSWQIVGVFTTEEEAVKHCTTEMHFVGPMELNVAHQDVNEKWEGSYYPKLEDKKLTDDELWKLIEKANWSKDNDYKRIEKEFKKLPISQQKQIKDFIEDKMFELNNKFEKDWTGKPGIPVGDDGWSDLRAEVVGRGKNFYDKISVKKLQEMAKTLDYHESFHYTVLDLGELYWVVEYLPNDSDKREIETGFTSEEEADKWVQAENLNDRATEISIYRETKAANGKKVKSKTITLTLNGIDEGADEEFVENLGKISFDENAIKTDRLERNKFINNLHNTIAESRGISTAEIRFEDSPNIESILAGGEFTTVDNDEDQRIWMLTLPDKKAAYGKKISSVNPTAIKYFEDEVEGAGYSVDDYTPAAWKQMFFFLVDEGFSFEGAKEVLRSKHTRWCRDAARDGELKTKAKSESQLSTFDDWKEYYDSVGKATLKKMLKDELNLAADGTELKTLKVIDYNETARNSGDWMLKTSDGIEEVYYFSEEDSELDYHGTSDKGHLIFVNKDDTRKAVARATSLTGNPDDPEWSDLVFETVEIVEKEKAARGLNVGEIEDIKTKFRTEYAKKDRTEDKAFHDFKNDLEAVILKKYGILLNDVAGLDNEFVHTAMENNEPVDSVAEYVGEKYGLTPISATTEAVEIKSPGKPEKIAENGYICVVKNHREKEVGRYPVSYKDEKYASELLNVLGVKLRPGDKMEILEIDEDED